MSIGFAYVWFYKGRLLRMLAAEPALVAAQYQRPAASVLWTVLASLDSVSSLCSQMVCIHIYFLNVKKCYKNVEV